MDAKCTPLSLAATRLIKLRTLGVYCF